MNALLSSHVLYHAGSKRGPSSALSIRPVAVDEAADTLDAREISRARRASKPPYQVRISLRHIAAATEMTTYNFTQPRIQIGRATDNDIVLSTPLRLVSRYHAEIYQLGDRYWASDLGSKRGTFHKEKEIAEDKPVLLSDGDALKVGDFLLTFNCL